jgi:hypothetical protein
MSYDDFYFKYLDIDYNREDIDVFLEKWPLIESRFHQMDVKGTAILLPSIFDWFKKNNLKVTQIFLINHKSGFKQNIHVDYIDDAGPKLAINFPLNDAAASSITRVYDFAKERQFERTHRHDNKVPYSYVSPDHVVQIGEYDSAKPVLLNITKPHSAWNNTDHIRGVLTFRFETNPDFLIKD